MIVKNGNTTIISLPGPPLELRQMVVDHVMPYLQQHYLPSPSFIKKSMTFRIFGIGESEIMEKIQGLLEASRAAGIKFSFYPRAGEVRLVISAFGEGSEAAALIDHLGGSLQNLLEESLYGTGEDIGLQDR